MSWPEALVLTTFLFSVLGLPWIVVAFIAWTERRPHE